MQPHFTPPIISAIMRRMLERNISVEITKVEDYYVPHIDGGDYTGYIYMSITNNSSQESYRVVGCNVVAKRPIFRFWHRTLKTFPAEAVFSTAPQSINEFDLPSLGVAKFRIDTRGEFEADRPLPRVVHFFVVFNMVGQIRKLERQCRVGRRPDPTLSLN